MRQELGLPPIIVSLAPVKHGSFLFATTDVGEQGDEEESMRNKLFRASESESESDSELESDSETESRLAPQLPPSTRPSPFQRQHSLHVRNGLSTLKVKGKTTRPTLVTPITPSIPVPVRAQSESLGSHLDDEFISEPDSTVASNDHEETDQTDHTGLSQINWDTVQESHTGANGHQQDAREGKVDLLSTMVQWLLQRQREGWDGSEAEIARLESIRKEVVDKRDNVFASLLDELTGQERKNVKFQSIIKSVVGTMNVIEPEKVHVPQAPFTKAIDGEWRLLWDRCRLTTRTITNDRKFQSQDFQHLEQSIEITFSSDPHYKAIVQQSADYPASLESDVLLKLNGSLARLLFVFVFEYPSPILQDQHSALLQNLYTMIGAAGMSFQDFWKDRPQQSIACQVLGLKRCGNFHPSCPNPVTHTNLVQEIWPKSSV